jgi:hypothetical protein
LHSPPRRRPQHKVYEDGVLTLDGKQAQLFDLDGTCWGGSGGVAGAAPAPCGEPDLASNTRSAHAAAHLAAPPPALPHSPGAPAGKQVSKSLMKLGGMDPGQTLELGRVSLEVTHPIAAAEYTSGRCFTAGAAGGGGGGDVAAAALAAIAPLRPALKPLASTAAAGGGVGVSSAPFKPLGGGLMPLGGGGLKPLGGGSLGSRPGLVPTRGLPPLGNTSGTTSGSSSGASGAADSSSSSSAASSYAAAAPATAAAGPLPGPRVSLGVGGSSFGGISKYGGGGGGISGGSSGGPAQPRHDPHAPNALVLSWPPGWAGAPPSASSQLAPALPLPGAPPQVPVVVDPVLTRALRPHQREGVQFLYDCVTGRRGSGGAGAGGAILADVSRWGHAWVRPREG